MNDQELRETLRSFIVFHSLLTDPRCAMPPTAEDCAIVVGQAFRQALGERKGIKR